MDGHLSVWLGQEGHTECSKVGPEQEVERVEGVCASCGMLHIFWSTKLPLRREFHSTVIAITTITNFKIVLWYVWG